MKRNITVKTAPGTYSIRAGGAELGESSNVLELREGKCDPVLYVPRKDIAMAFFDQSETISHCPRKGKATHFTIQSKSGPIKNAAWSYKCPEIGLEKIANHLAFYPDLVTVEEV